MKAFEERIATKRMEEKKGKKGKGISFWASCYYNNDERGMTEQKNQRERGKKGGKNTFSLPCLLLAPRWGGEEKKKRGKKKGLLLHLTSFPSVALLCNKGRKGGGGRKKGGEKKKEG